MQLEGLGLKSDPSHCKAALDNSFIPNCLWARQWKETFGKFVIQNIDCCHLFQQFPTGGACTPRCTRAVAKGYAKKIRILKNCKEN